MRAEPPTRRAEAPRVAIDQGEVGALAALWAGEIDGLWLKGALSLEAVAALRAAAAELPARSAPPFPGTTHGSVLIVTPDRARYFEDAARLRACMESLGLHAPLLALLGRLAGAPVEVPEEGGQTYAAVTIRRLPPGLEVAVHSERWAWPSMGWHRARLTPRWHLSFYLPLNALPDGGELELFHRPAEGQSLEGLSPAAARDRLAAFGTTTLRPGPGDLLLFDGGRFNHRVCPSSAERWTLGGFAGRDAAGKLWVWS